MTKQTQVRPTQQMLKRLPRHELEELTEYFGHLLGRLLQVSEHAISDIEQSNIDLESQLPSYVAFKEETETITDLLDKEE